MLNNLINMKKRPKKLAKLPYLELWMGCRGTPVDPSRVEDRA